MGPITEFAALVSSVARAVLRLEREQVCCGDLTLQQFEALRAIREAGSLTPGDHARLAGIDISTASRNLALLERNGYVNRARAASDGRRVGVRLTPRGEAAVETLCCDERVVLASVLARVPAAQQAAVIEALGVLSRALQEPAPGCCPGGTGGTDAPGGMAGACGEGTVVPLRTRGGT